MKNIFKVAGLSLLLLSFSSCDDKSNVPQHAKLSITGSNDDFKVIGSDASQMFVNVSSSSDWSIKLEPKTKGEDFSWLSVDPKNGKSVESKDIIATFKENTEYERSLYLILQNSNVADTILITQQGKKYSDKVNPDPIPDPIPNSAISSFNVDFENGAMPQYWESKALKGKRKWLVKEHNKKKGISINSHKTQDTDHVILYTPLLNIDGEKTLKYDMTISHGVSGTILRVLLLDENKEIIRSIISYDMGANSISKESFDIEANANIKYIGFLYEGDPTHTANVVLDNIILMDKGASVEPEPTPAPQPQPNPISPDLKSEHIHGDMNRLEIPRLAGGSNNWFVSYKLSNGSVNYSLEWDSNWKIPRWVAFTFDQSNSRKNHSGRNDKWGWDKIISPAKDIKQPWFKGYDRGHMVASNDRQISAEANGQTFYYTNMTPQLKGLNQQFWASLESLVQDWARDTRFNDNIMYVTKGVAFNNNQPTNWNYGGKIAIPDYYYMAILHKGTNDNYNAIGFWVEHKDLPKSANKSQFVMSIDDIERKANVDLFPNLPDDVESKVEAQNPLQKNFFRL